MNNSSNKLKECEFCRTNATCLCFKCSNYFCDKCFKVIHGLEKNANHKKENIDYYVPIDIKCQYHPLNPLNLFCVDEKGKIKNIKYNLY